MTIARVDGMFSSEYLRLGFMRCDYETRRSVALEIRHMANAWKPKRARSYTVRNVERDRYRPGHYHMVVTYYTTASEGRHLVEDTHEVWQRLSRQSYADYCARKEYTS